MIFQAALSHVLFHHVRLASKTFSIMALFKKMTPEDFKRLKGFIMDGLSKDLDYAYEIANIEKGKS